MTLRPKDSPAAIWLVWKRYFAIFRKSWLYGLMVTIVEPMLILFAFGVGMHAMIGDMSVDGVALSYRQFVLAGVAGQAVLLQGFFEGAYGSFIRMYYQRIFQAIAVTPITLSEVLWAELIWDATRASFSAAMVLLIGVILGDFDPLGALASVPLVCIGGLLFGSMGVFCAGRSRTIEELNYPQYLVAIPMFLFCGVFFPVSTLPEWFQPVVYALPLTALVEAVRGLTLEVPFPAWALPSLFLWTIVTVPAARRQMTKRLVS
ncbi:MAG: ABC transporter permease [Opitutales bacterium]